MKTSGTVKIWDIDIDEDPRNTRSAIGVVPQEINFDPFFTPQQLLDIQAGLYGVPKAERRSMELLELVGLKDKAGAYTRSLSGGMRRRLMVAKAMVHTPPVLVLDEPTAGVDVELRKQLWENVRMLNRRGVTILLTTHYLKEAEELCDRIAIINHGRIIVDESKEALLSRIDSKTLRVRVDRDVDAVPAVLSPYAPTLEGGRVIMLKYSPSERSAGEVLEAVRAAGLGISDLSVRESDLEDVFLELTRAA
jgi:ABC-2 type transport system ATP-binding protein